MAKEKGQTRKYISEKEVAEYLGIAERTLRSWRSNGRIDNKGTPPPRAYVRGKHVYYELGELEEWIRCGAEDGHGARENAASETIMEEKRMNEEKNHRESSMTADHRLVPTIDEIKRYIGDSRVVAFDLETAPDAPYRGKDKAALDPAKAHIVGCSFSVRPGTGIYVPIACHPFYCGVDRDELAAFMRELMLNPRIVKIAHNLAFESMMLYKEFGIVIQEPVYDTMCAAQLVYHGDNKFRRLGECGLKQLARELFKVNLPTFEETTVGKHFDELDPNDEKTVGYAARDADFALMLHYKFNKEFHEYISRHRGIVEGIESPTSVYTGLMKANGLTLDTALMDHYSQKAEAEMKRLREEIRLIIGGVNIGKCGTTNKLKEYLFKDKNLPVVKRTEKDKVALDEEALALLQEYCESGKANREQSALLPLFPLLCEYRSWAKIHRTYIEGYKKHINSETGRIHPEMLSLSTATGRMSCSCPNVQNMPRKDNDPVGVRKFISAPQGYCYIAADYSQIELRVGAFYCCDPKMLQIYGDDGDIHALTTSIIYGITYEEATDKHNPFYKERRVIAKIVNFGIFYGLYPKGLRKTLKFKAGIDKSEEECADIIGSIKRGYRMLSVWQEATKAKAKQGYVETWLGRRRHLPDIRSNYLGRKSYPERCALNTPIQGTAADIIKLAMARILKGLPEREWLKPVLQIHDELLFLVPEDRVREAADFIRDCMEAKPFDGFNIPLKVELSRGKNYGEMDELED